MKSLLSALDSFSELCGRLLALLVYAVMLVTCLVVVLRYGFDISYIAMQESISYLHASVFMLGMAYTLKEGAHVRVDIFYRNFSPRKKAWVDLLGSLIFLVPLAAFIVFISWEFVSLSWGIKEKSVEASGIPAVFLLKSLIPAAAILLLLQAVAEAIRNVFALRAEQPKE